MAGRRPQLVLKKKPKGKLLFAVGLVLAVTVFISVLWQQNFAPSEGANKGLPEVAGMFISPDGKEVSFTLEVARTPKERRTGLMHRSHMEEGRGMLFVFERPQFLSFWMKNTLIPLDMVFVDGMQVVGVVENAQPEDLSQYHPTPNFPANYVVELNAGMVKQHGITRGWGLKVSSSRR